MKSAPLLSIVLFLCIANKYLTGFSRLIRATLHNSSRNFISLADEIDYLSTYLSLEKLRFKEKMDYTIEVDPSIDKDLIIIPPMLIQSFVENSMRHGLRHKIEGRELFISVEDADGRAAGTRVSLEFPIFHLATQNVII